MRAKRVKRTAAQIAARKIFRDPIYQEYRGKHFNMGAKEAYELVKEIYGYGEFLAEEQPYLTTAAGYFRERW